MMSHPLLPKLRQLKLSGMVSTLDVRAAQATERQLSPVEFLALLLDDELERRNQQRLTLRLAQSGCDGQKTLARFDFAAAPGVNRSLLPALSSPGTRISCYAAPLALARAILPTPWPSKPSSATTVSCHALPIDCWPTCMPPAPMAPNPASWHAS